MRAWASMEYTRLVQTTSPPRYYLFDASSVEMSGDVDREERYGREREREAGDSLLYLGMGWEPIKGGAQGRRASDCAWILGAPARPALYWCMERCVCLRVWSVPYGRRTGLTA